MPQLVTLDVVQELGDVRLERREALLERRHGLGGDAVHLLLARLLARDADRVAQPPAEGALEIALERGDVGRRQQRALRLAGSRREVLLDAHQPPDVLHRELERRDHVLLGNLAAPALDHNNVLRGSRDHDVHVAVFELRHRRHHDQRPVGAPDPHRRDRLRERDVGQAHRRGRPDQRQYIGVVFLIRRHHGRHDLSLVRELLLEQRPVLRLVPRG